MPLMAGTPSGPFLSSSQVQFETSPGPKCSKGCCPICIGPDEFNAGNGVLIKEESAGLDRIIIQWCVPCLTKDMNYRVTQNGGNNLLHISQPRRFIPTSGRWMSVEEGGQLIGNVGLPGSKTLCKTEEGFMFCLAGCRNLSTLCYGHRYAPIYRNGMTALSLPLFCLNGCQTLPLLVMNAEEQVQYKVSAPIMQMGVLCPFLYCLQPGRQIKFKVTSPGGEEITDIEHEGTASCICYPCHTSSKFTINFPERVSDKDRALLFAASLALYEMYFDN